MNAVPLALPSSVRVSTSVRGVSNDALHFRKNKLQTKCQIKKKKNEKSKRWRMHEWNVERNKIHKIDVSLQVHRINAQNIVDFYYVFVRPFAGPNESRHSVCVCVFAFTSRIGNAWTVICVRARHWPGRAFIAHCVLRPQPYPLRDVLVCNGKPAKPKKTRNQSLRTISPLIAY